MQTENFEDINPNPVPGLQIVLKDVIELTDEPKEIAGPTAEAESETTPPYSRGPQIVPMSVPRGDRTFNVSIETAAISDDDYFRLMDEITEHAKRAKDITMDVFAPLANLGRRLAIARHGFKERDDWRETTRDEYFINAVKSMLEVVQSGDEIESDDLLDEDAEIRIVLSSIVSGEECRTAIYFRESSKADMDEYQAALGNRPRKNALASAKKLSKQQRLFDLYEKLKTRAENYEDGHVPAWHGVAAVTACMEMQFAALGKSNLA